MFGVATRFWRDTSAAVAPILALVLFALIAAGGIAFDYARVAAMDTELQSAADQAALAAAGQLDGETGSRDRATAAANDLVSNLTLFANDGDADGLGVTIELVEFYSSYSPSRANLEDPPGAAATTDADAAYVRVTVNSRVAEYAFTPVVAAFTSGDISARALAGLGSAICNTPPVMMCNPAEPEGNTDDEYPFSASTGDGIRLIVGSASAPGNFGFLQTGYGTGAQDLARALGYNNPPANCAATNGVSTEPGDKESVRAAFNTRFDLSEAGNTCPSGGTCSPSRNVRKDLVRGNNCSTSGNQAWQESANPYRPTTTTPLDGTADPDVMGHPRDMCHAVSVDGVCGGAGIIGDGEWDRDAYFRVNYGWDSTAWQTNTGLGSGATRYQVYTWELNNPAQADQLQTDSNTNTATSYPVCRPPGITPNATTPDRRRISVAVVNCEAQGLAGRENNVQVLDWMDVFLVEPAFRRDSGARTDNGDIYVELIGQTNTGSNGVVAGQVIRRDVPRLLE